MSPHNLEAEQALLGAVLFDNRLMDRLDALAPEHFYAPEHGAVFAKARAMIGAGQHADAITLRLWAQGVLPAEIGGATYLLTLLKHAAPLNAHAVEYAQQIRADAQRRAALLALSDAAQAIEAGEEVFAAVAGAEAALRHIQSAADAEARAVADAGVVFLADLGKLGVRTGYTALDKRLGGFQRGDLVILAGRPSMGKTAFAAELARAIARRGQAVHFASLEMSAEQIARRCISAATFDEASALDRVAYAYIRHDAPGLDLARLNAVARALPATLLVDDRAAQTLAQLEAGARATRKRLGQLDLIVVDYLQLMRAVRSDGRVHEVTEISQGLKAIAKRLNAPLLALCQLNRSVESRENKRPTLADLRDSGAIEQDADVVLAVYREAYYLEREGGEESDEQAFRRLAKLDACRNDIEIITLKQRQGPCGTDKFLAWLEFDTIREVKP